MNANAQDSPSPAARVQNGETKTGGHDDMCQNIVAWYFMGHEYSGLLMSEKHSCGMKAMKNGINKIFKNPLINVGAVGKMNKM